MKVYVNVVNNLIYVEEEPVLTDGRLTKTNPLLILHQSEVDEFIELLKNAKNQVENEKEKERNQIRNQIRHLEEKLRAI